MKQLKKQCLTFTLALLMMLTLSVPAIATDTTVYDEPVAEEYQGYDPMADYEDYTNQELLECGGVAGQINVKYNGKCIQFTDVIPEIKNDRTMVPMRAVVETLGIQVEYLGDQTVELVDGDTVIHLKAYETVATVETAEGIEEITMDSASYISNDRTYVPLRFVSEALGYDVFWDGMYRTVVIMDKEAMIQDINETFSVLNLFYVSQMSKQKEMNQIETGTFDLDVELAEAVAASAPIDALNIDGEFETHTTNSAATVEMTVDFGQIVDLVDMYAPMFFASSDIDEAEKARMEALIEDLKENLKDSDFAYKMSKDGKLYFKAELVDIFMLMSETFTEEELGDAWYLMDGYYGMKNMEIPETLGEFAYMYLELMQNSMQSSFDAYEVWMEIRDGALLWVGDDTFELKNDRYVWEMDKAELIELMAKMDPDMDEAYMQEEAEAIKQADIRFRFKEDGAFDLLLDVEMEDEYNHTTFNYDVEANAYSDFTVDYDIVIENEYQNININLDIDATMRGTEALFTVDVEDVVEVTFTVDTKIQQVDYEPDMTIPDTANIIDIMDLQ